MASFINSNSLSGASLVVGVACGTVVGYTLSASGDLLNNTLIVASCGISRVAHTLIFHHPLNRQIMTKLIELEATNDEQITLELDALSTRKTISSVFYCANVGFSSGIALGSVWSATSLLPGILNGSIIHVTGILTEWLPVKALATIPSIITNENGEIVQIT